MSEDFGSFKFLTGDVNFVDHGGKWSRHVTKRRYHVISLDRNPRDCRDNGKYYVTLREVDLDAIGEKTIASALRSCGWEIAANGDIENEHDGATVCEAISSFRELVIVEACHGHGAAAPISDENGNNYRKLIRAAISESRSLDDPETHAAAMDRPVNAIGSTAAEYARGDITSAIKRGESVRDPAAMLIAKVYRHCGGRTLGGEIIDVGPAPDMSATTVEIGENS